MRRHPDTTRATPRGPGRPRSVEAHDAILGAAVALTREVGYDAVTMDGIAERAGVGKATVYRRWTSKEAVIAEAVARIVTGVGDPDTGTVGGDLRALMRVAVGMYGDAATALLLSGLVAAMARSAAIAHAVRAGFVAAWGDAARRALARGVARNELRPDADLALAVDLLGGPLLHRYLLLGRPVDESLAAAVVDAVLRALAPER